MILKYNNLIDYFICRDMIYSKTGPNKIIADTRIGLFDGGMSHILTIMYSMCRLGLGNIPQIKSVWDILDSKQMENTSFNLEIQNIMI